MRDLRVNVGNIEIQIREYEREESPVIFLHFGGGNLMMWQRVVPYFTPANNSHSALRLTRPCSSASWPGKHSINGSAQIYSGALF
jgi:pimeloyl-ACP methyl ester carboxylesterase